MLDLADPYYRHVRFEELSTLPSGTPLMRYDPETLTCSGMYQLELTDRSEVAIVGYRTQALFRREGIYSSPVPFRWRPYESLFVGGDPLTFGTRVRYPHGYFTSDEQRWAIPDQTALTNLVGVASIAHLKLIEFDPFESLLPLSDKK